MKQISFFILVLSTAVCFAQAKPNLQASQIQQLATNYQTCLDKGENMYGCAVTYYKVLDSCLNLAYRQLNHKLDRTQQQNLKLDELTWLRTRDKKFKAIDQTNNPGKDGEMIKQDQKNTIVKERVLLLVKKLNE